MRTRRPITADNALARLETLCARSEQCTYELRQKLYRMALPASDIESVLESLAVRRFVDDSRYASAFVRDKYRFARWGRRKIAAALAAKHIPSDLIREALEQDVDPDEYDSILAELMRSKARTIAEGNTYEGRTRLYRFAAARGFETELILRHIRHDADIWPQSSTE